MNSPSHYPHSSTDESTLPEWAAERLRSSERIIAQSDRLHLRLTAIIDTLLNLTHAAQSPDSEAGDMTTVIQRLGEAVEARQLGLWEHDAGSIYRRVSLAQIHASAIPLPCQLDLPARWDRQLQAGRMVYGGYADFPPDEQQWLARVECQAVVIAPVMQDERLWGVLYIHCPPESHALRASTMVHLALITRLIGIAVHQHQHHAQQRTLMERFNLAVEGVHDGLLDWDIAKDTFYISPRFVATLGYERDEMPGEPLAWLEWMHPEDTPLFMESFHRFVNSKWMTFQAQYRVRHKFGSYIWVLLRVVVIRDPTDQFHCPLTGNIKRLVATQTDITDFNYQTIQEREQRRLVQTLYETLRKLSVTLDEAEILEALLTQSSKVIPQNVASIAMIADGGVRLAMYYLPLLDSSIRRLNAAPVVAPDAHPLYAQMHNTQQPYLLSQAQPVELIAALLPAPVVDLIAAYALDGFSYLGAPIVLEGETIGFLNIIRWQIHDLHEAHIERIIAFTDQASLAIYRARLYQQAGEIASLRERQRIASDLHDAVSQTLFSANMLSEILPGVWEKNRQQGEEYLRELNMLTREALAEMRSLLVELRPETLTQPDLNTLLGQLIETFRSRGKFQITLSTVGSTYRLPDEVQIVFYRVTQEALSNILKYAQARTVMITVQWSRLQVALMVIDDGVGFDLYDVPANHFGIQIMRERAHSIGAYVHIESVIGQGTQVYLTWQNQIN